MSEKMVEQTLIKLQLITVTRQQSIIQIKAGRHFKHTGVKVWRYWTMAATTLVLVWE